MSESVKFEAVKQEMKWLVNIDQKRNKNMSGSIFVDFQLSTQQQKFKSQNLFSKFLEYVFQIYI